MSDDYKPTEEDFEEFAAEMCGIPLDVMMDDDRLPKEPMALISLYIAMKIGRVATEVFDRSEAANPEVKAAFAKAMIEVLVQAARKGGVHKQQLAAALRGAARQLM